MPLDFDQADAQIIAQKLTRHTEIPWPWQTSTPSPQQQSQTASFYYGLYACRDSAAIKKILTLKSDEAKPAFLMPKNNRRIPDKHGVFRSVFRKN